MSETLLRSKTPCPVCGRHLWRIWVIDGRGFLKAIDAAKVDNVSPFVALIDYDDGDADVIKGIRSCGYFDECVHCQIAIS